jgi:hypothetical protein
MFSDKPVLKTGPVGRKHSFDSNITQRGNHDMWVEKNSTPPNLK